MNCQVLLKGTETSGYVIVSAAKAHILQREHKPVWKHGTIVPKTTWVGALEGMQYYATVSAGSLESPEGIVLRKAGTRIIPTILTEGFNFLCYRKYTVVIS